MNENNERVEQFKKELAGMGISTPAAERERWLLIGGVVAMVAGFVAILVGTNGAQLAETTPEALSYVMSGGVIGLGLIIIGGLLFLRYSLSRYLRFWMIRLIYEEQANTDRVVQANEELERAIYSIRVKKKE